MRIALIGARNHPAQHGGIERAVESLAAEYTAAGHQVTVMVAEAGEGDPAVRQVRSLRGKYLQALTQALASVPLTSRRSFDVAHVHGIGPGMVVPLLRARGVPVVLTVHALDFERDKWPPAAKRVFRALSRPGVRCASRVIAVADHLRQDVKDLYGVDSVVVPNGVSVPATEEFEERLRAADLEPGRYLLFVGRLVPEKRVETLLRAYGTLGTTTPLVVVGSGEGSYTGTYEQDLRSTAPEGVHFAGHVSHDAVCDLVAGAAALVNPSSLEGMPLTVLEARVLGTPVVLSDIPPHREVGGASTLWFPLDDVPALAKALGDALDRGEELREQAVREQPEVEARFSWPAVAARTLEVYEEAISRRT